MHPYLSNRGAANQRVSQRCKVSSQWGGEVSSNGESGRCPGGEKICMWLRNQSRQPLDTLPCQSSPGIRINAHCNSFFNQSVYYPHAVNSYCVFFIVRLWSFYAVPRLKMIYIHFTLCKFLVVKLNPMQSNTLSDTRKRRKKWIFFILEFRHSSFTKYATSI